MEGTLAIGFERTGNRDFLEAGLLMLDTAMDTGLAHRPTGEVKSSAMDCRALCRFLGHADREGVLERFEFPTLRSRRLIRYVRRPFG